MDGAAPPIRHSSGISMLQEVRGRYLSLTFDVDTLLRSYIQILDQLSAMVPGMKTCKLQCRLLYEGHSALYSSLQQIRLNGESDAELRFAGGLELAYHAIKTFHSQLEEYSGLDEMESWFRYSTVAENIADLWRTLDVAIQELRVELGTEITSYIGLKDTPARVVVVPGSGDLPLRQAQRADELELPNFFRNLVVELDASSSLIAMKKPLIELFMGAVQKEMYLQHSARSQLHKLYDERLHRLYERTRVLPPVNEFDTQDIERQGSAPMYESSYGGVWRGKLGVGDTVAIKTIAPLLVTERSQEALYRNIQRWNRLRHANLQRIIGIWYHPRARDGHFSVVSKWIKRGPALPYIKANPTFDKMHLLLGVALGAQYLHANDTPHGDIRGANIFIKENGEACLTNFGLIQTLESACDIRVNQALVNCGATRWIAPELHDPELSGQERTSITLESDCHSFGMLILEITTGQRPFSYISQDSVVLSELVRGGRPLRPEARVTGGLLDDRLWALTESCWAFPPDRRATMDGIVHAIRAHQHHIRSPNTTLDVGIPPSPISRTRTPRMNPVSPTQSPVRSVRDQPLSLNAASPARSYRPPIIEEQPIPLTPEATPSPPLVQLEQTPAPIIESLAVIDDDPPAQDIFSPPRVTSPARTDPAPLIYRLPSSDSGTTPSDVSFQQRAEVIRVQSTVSQSSQGQSVHQSQHSRSSSARSSRSPRHPDLMAHSTPSFGLADLYPSGPVNRLSTIHDAEEYESQNWDGGEEGHEDLDFLQLVQEHRRAKQGPNADGIYVPPPRSSVQSGDAGEGSAVYDPYQQQNFIDQHRQQHPDIFPTPVDLSAIKPLPDVPGDDSESVPSTSYGGSRVISTQPFYPPLPPSTMYPESRFTSPRKSTVYPPLPQSTYSPSVGDALRSPLYTPRALGAALRSPEYPALPASVYSESSNPGVGLRSPATNLRSPGRTLGARAYPLPESVYSESNSPGSRLRSPTRSPGRTPRAQEYPPLPPSVYADSPIATQMSPRLYPIPPTAMHSPSQSTERPLDTFSPIRSMLRSPALPPLPESVIYSQSEEADEEAQAHALSPRYFATLLRSPALPPLPPSVPASVTASTNTSSSSKTPRAKTRSSALSHRGSQPPAENNPDLLTRSGNDTPNDADEIQSVSTTTTTRAALKQQANATCGHCGKVFLTPDALSKHISSQGGLCTQHSLKEELDLWGDFDDE